MTKIRSAGSAAGRFLTKGRGDSNIKASAAAAMHGSCLITQEPRFSMSGVAHVVAIATTGYSLWRASFRCSENLLKFE